MLKNSKWLLSAILFYSLISCGPKPPDVPVFESLDQIVLKDAVTGHLLLTPSPICLAQIGEPECGHGIFIMSGKEIFIGEKAPYLLGGKPWSKIKSQSVYVPSIESYAPLTAYIINSCKKMGCDKSVEGFKVKIKSLKGISALAP